MAVLVLLFSLIVLRDTLSRFSVVEISGISYTLSCKCRYGYRI